MNDINIFSKNNYICPGKMVLKHLMTLYAREILKTDRIYLI